ncbi:MAG: ligase-associated DNA damage response exonuclease [Rhodospirillales bacterium]|nr:ligase-associated DNA damage response exonuclease [Rhodospirillales bacterium]
MPPHPETWLKPTPSGLYCVPGDFCIDPVRAVPRAIITHGHSDHARPGHTQVLATPETLAIMRVRMGEERAGASQQALPYGETLKVGDVSVTLVPAGHVLGSAQVVMDYHGSRAVVSGDYKRQPDPTCLPFEPMRCDVFVTEATFGLPVFRHPPPEGEIGKLLRSHALFPERTHVVGSYSLGKSQRLIAMLRQAGYEAPIYLHGAHANLCALYETLGVRLGDLRPATSAQKAQMKGAMVLAPPSAVGERWGRRLEDPVVAQASGWMRIRQRAKASGIELPLIISDHADWDDLLATIKQTQAPEIWVTHGSEEALIRACALMQIRARALSLVGYGEDIEE